MRALSLLNAARGERLSVLCLGAHCDDIDIGCGGALLALLDQYEGVDVTWVAFSAPRERAKELRRSARRLPLRLRCRLALRDRRGAASLSSRRRDGAPRFLAGIFSGLSDGASMRSSGDSSRSRLAPLSSDRWRFRPSRHAMNRPRRAPCAERDRKLPGLRGGY